MSEYNFDGIPDDNEFEGESQSQYDLSGIPDDDDSADVSISLQQKYNSANQNPDQIATAKRHAEKAGIPMLVAQNQPDKAAKLANAPDWTRLTKDAPITARTLSNDGTFFQIAHDDHEALGGIERGLLTLGKALPVAGPLVQAADTTRSLIEGMTGINIMGDKDDVGTVIWKYGENMDNQASKAGLGLFMAGDSALAHFLAPNAGEGTDGWYYRQNKGEIDAVVDRIATLDASDDPLQKNAALQLAQEYGFDSVPRLVNRDRGINRLAILKSVIDKKASDYQASTNDGIIDKNKRRDELVELVRNEDEVLKANAAQVDAYTVPWLVSNSLQFIQQMAQGAAASSVAGPPGAAVAFGAPVFGGEYATAKAAGKTDDNAAIDAGASALIEGTTEMIGLKSIEDAAKGLLPILQGVGRATGTNFSQEQAAEIAGQVYNGFANDKHVEQPDYIKGLDAPEPVKQFLAILDQQLQAGVIGAAGGGAMAGTGAGVKAGVDKYNERKQAKLDEQVQQVREQIDTARTRSSQIIETIEKIRTSKLKARDTSSLKALIQSIGDAENDAPTAMLLSADAFKQGGIDPDVFKRAVPSAADQVDRAIELGGTIAIDIGELANITDSEVEQGLIPHLKVREEEWTQYEAEAAELQSDEAMAEMQEAADTAAREAENQDEWTRQSDEIRTKYEEQLNKVGQYDKAANKKMAALVSAFYSTTASKLAKHDKTMTPIRLFNEAMMRTQGGLAGGLVFRQGQSFDSVKEAWSSAGIDGQIFENGDVITVSKIVVPKDKRGAVAVTKAMRQLIDYADANGKHIVLSPSGDFGGDVKRLKKFYKGMGFVENKGKNRAFSTRETMYRQADGKLLYQPGIDSGNDESRVKDKADGEGQGNDTVSETQSRVVQWANSVGLHGRTGISTVGRSYSEASRYKGEFSGKSNPFISADERITTAEEGRAEQERLISTAKENGFFLGFGHPFFESLEVYESHGGMEHDAYIVGDAPNKVVIRSTTKGEFGHANKHSPADYLKRIDNYNKLFPDLKIEMIGVHQDSDGSAQIWTAQKFAPGNPFKSDAELDAALRKKGWYQEGISAPGLPKRYKHKESGAIIADVHPDNILHDGDNLYPIDVIVEKLPDRLYQNESAPRGAFNPNTLNITLLEGADLSTFLHESGHFFLEMYARYADQSAEIGADMDALLKWFGVKGDDQAARLAAWRAMSVDQQKDMHEQFAESFEQYLFTGKAPSIALQPAFASYRRWLANVYKSLARFVAGHSGAKLNPEIAAVMDRMLATQDQIDEMTQARNSRPLFANADQAGMTQAQWDAYMQDQVRSVEQAADTLVARSLRDMKWLTNAKNKQLRKLQREAQALRAQVQMEARRTVLSSPEYRAWLFLKRATEKKAKKPANSKTVDPSQDSLLTAIAKFGGLDMEEVVSSWGVDPADFAKKGGVFGKPVLRRTGGLSIETIAEKLLEEGYLTPDQHGKVDLAEFEEKLDRAARGEPMYSMFADYDLLLYGDEKRSASPRKEDIDYIGGRLNRNDLVDMYGTNNPEVKWHRPIAGMLLQPAYHGSPYRFDKFSLDHMGKGEGAQAYGWGLYFAGKREVAEYYRKTLTATKSLREMQFNDDGTPNRAGQVAFQIESGISNADIRDGLSVLMDGASEAEINSIMEQGRAMYDEAQKAGQLYKVEIPEDDTYLLWDKPLSEQPEKVLVALGVKDSKKVADLKKQLKKAAGNVFNGGDDISGLFSDNEHTAEMDRISLLIQQEPNGVLRDRGFDEAQIAKMIRDDVSGESLYTWISGIKGQEYGSKILHSYGLNGIKYLDGSSRGAGDGNYNYVIFDDNAIEIIETFYQNEDNQEDDQPVTGNIRTLESMGMVSDDGLHPDVVAELFGLSSGDELVRKLLEIDDPFTAVDKLTDKIMMERHSEFTDQKELERMAEAAIHNEARVRFVATELAMLNKAEGGQKDLKRIIDAARLYAQDLLAGQRIQDIRPSKHAADAARAGKESAREFAKGNLAATIMAKRNQVLHTELVRQAHAAKDEVDKGLKYFARIEKAVNNGVLDADYAQQIIGLLQQHDLRKSVSLIDLERRESLAAWVQAQQDAGFEPMIPENLLMEAAKTHYKRMTLDEFRELVDAIKNIDHLGRLKYKLVQNARKRELAAAAAEIGEAIADNATGEVQTRLEKNSVKDRIFDLANGFLYMHRKFASLIRQMDGWKDGGVLWDYFVKTMNDAGDREAVMREQATMAMADLMKPLHESGGFGMMPKKLFITQIGTSLTREGRLMVALNWGNEGNRQRLMDGEGWDVNQVNAVLATLNAEDWKFVQGVWDHLETYRPMVGEQQKRLSGVEPKWIEASPFMVAGKDGQTYELRGGYLPVKYDADRSTKSLTQDALSNIMDQHKAVRAKTRDSFTKGRAAKVVNRPLRKDFGVIFQHMAEVTHRLAWQDWLMDSKRLLAQPAVDEAVRKHYGPAMVTELQKTLDDIAIGEVGPANEFEAAINHLRTGATVAGLGLNFMTSLMQPLGLTQSMVRIGPTWVMKGLAKWGRMEDALPWIYERSDLMRLRGKTASRELNEELNKIRSPKRAAFNDMMFILIQKGQIIADVPTWLGAYEKAIAEQGPNIDEKLAAKLADQAVLDAQSGGMQKDLARIQRGGSLRRLFTMFFSYFSSTYNLSVESVRKVNVKDPATIMSAAIDFLLLYSIPAAISTAISSALTGDDDEDEFWGKMARGQVSYFLSVMVGVREFGSVVNGFSGYSGPAGTRFFNEAAKLATQIGQGDMDAALLKALNNVGGILFHYPAGQINKTIDGAVDLSDDKTDNPAALLFGSRK